MDFWELNIFSRMEGARGEGKHTMPVEGSTERESVSTAITCVDLSFQGQYLRQLAVETSSHE